MRRGAPSPHLFDFERRDVYLAELSAMSADDYPNFAHYWQLRAPEQFTTAIRPIGRDVLFEKLLWNLLRVRTIICLYIYNFKNYFDCLCTCTHVYI